MPSGVDHHNKPNSRTGIIKMDGPREVVADSTISNIHNSSRIDMRNSNILHGSHQDHNGVVIPWISRTNMVALNNRETLLLNIMIREEPILILQLSKDKEPLREWV